jgi:spore coat protein A, manganese oxidase
MKITRRQFLKGTAAVGVGMALPLKFGVGKAHAFAQSPQLTKWIQPIRGLGPSGIPVMNGVPDPVFANTKYYQITVGEFMDQLHPQLGSTRLWGYWDTTSPLKRHLGGVILARRGTASRIRFTNTLPQINIIPVDITIPQPASQAQNRTATHLHGGLVPWICDGGPHDWFAPNGASGASFLNGPTSVLDNITAANGVLVPQPMVAGQADYYYPNDQGFRLVWYHDHAWGITRLNAYAGIASAYLIQDSIDDAYVTAGKIPGLPSTIPLVWQDKIFVNPATTLVYCP